MNAFFASCRQPLKAGISNSKSPGAIREVAHFLRVVSFVGVFNKNKIQTMYSSRLSHTAPQILVSNTSNTAEIVFVENKSFLVAHETGHGHIKLHEKGIICLPLLKLSVFLSFGFKTRHFGVPAVHREVSMLTNCTIRFSLIYSIYEINGPLCSEVETLLKN